MYLLGYTSIHKWRDDLRNDNVLKYLLETFEDLSVSNHYDFIECLLVVKNIIYYTNELLDKYKNGTDPDTDRTLYRLQLKFNSLVVNTFFSFIAYINIHLDVWN